VIDAIQHAKDYVHNALESSFPLGKGHGPLNHFYQIEQAINVKKK
jgi:hydroxymethylpyrimidine/phosphomethylpyrimidine kinase